MDEPSERELEVFLEQKRKEHREHREKLRKQGGLALIISSLLMSVLFLGALKYSIGSPGLTSVPVFFLAVSVALFAWGLKNIVSKK